MSGNGSYIKSMNGIVSFDTGGTTIEGGNITADTVDCDTINAVTANISSTINTSTIYTDFILNNANPSISIIGDTKFNNDLYVDNIYSNITSQVSINNNTVINGSLTPNRIYTDKIDPNTSGLVTITNLISNSLKTESIDGRDTSSLTKQLKIGQNNTYTTSVNIGRAALTILGTTFPAIPPRTTFYPVGNDDICNKFYVDSVVSGTTILDLENTFTGTTNTFNNITANGIIKTDTITIPSNNLTINNGSTGTTSTILTIGSAGEIQINNNSITSPCRLFHTTTNANITIGVGQTAGTLFIGTAPTRTSSIQIGATGCNTVIRGPIVGNLGITTSTINSITPANTFNILPSHTGPISIGGSSSNINLEDVVNFVGATGQISISASNIASSTTTDTINLFNNISGATGKVNMCSSLILSKNSIGSTGATDAISLFKNITTGTITMASNIVFKEDNIQSIDVNDSMNLFSNITTGDLFIMRNSTNGSVVIGNGNATSGNGGGVSIGTGRRCTTTIGNSFNNSTLVNNGCCTIQKLRVGTGTGYSGTGYRCTIIGRDIGAGVGGATSYTIPNAPTGFGLPIVFAQMNAGLSTQYIFSVSISVTDNDKFTYYKFLQTRSTTGGANAESFNYVAYWL